MKDRYKALRLEQIAEQESFFFCEAEADLIIETELHRISDIYKDEDGYWAHCKEGITLREDTFEELIERIKLARR